MHANDEEGVGLTLVLALALTLTLPLPLAPSLPLPLPQVFERQLSKEGLSGIATNEDVEKAVSRTLSLTLTLTLASRPMRTSRRR